MCVRSILEKNFKNFLNIVFYKQNFNRLISLTNCDKNGRIIYSNIIYSLLHNVTACHLSMKNFWQHHPSRRDLEGFKVGSSHEKNGQTSRQYPKTRVCEEIRIVEGRKRGMRKVSKIEDVKFTSPVY